jgi:hypothetical protein
MPSFRSAASQAAYAVRALAAHGQPRHGNAGDGKTARLGSRTKSPRTPQNRLNPPNQRSCSSLLPLWSLSVLRALGFRWPCPSPPAP